MAKRTKGEWLADNLERFRDDPSKAVDWVLGCNMSGSEKSVLIVLIQRGLLLPK